MKDEARWYDWPKEAQTMALAEGWDVFECGSDQERAEQIVNGKPYGDRPFELQAWMEAGVFGDDADAQAFVVQRANEGSELHKAALDFLRRKSPVEYAAIMEGK